ncbi:MAG TPA: tripartite tricarboxylate transporter substrate-binding protein [Burkholderiaceae bacterium]|nr:tripartite tricarboxylate transporter substrate-binding protein [Burkholderiaceae bacterium]
MKTTRRQLLGLVAAAGAGVTFPATAQTAWPRSKPISIIVPFGAGGSLDGTTRVVAQQLATRLGQSVTVDNATGAGGTVGIGKGIAAAPDGYTFLMAGDAPLVPGGPGQSSYRFDVLRELMPVSLVNTAPMVLVAHPSVPANNFDELVAHIRRNPGRLNYASSGVGTLPHLAMEMVKRKAGLHIVHIPYRGGAQIANDVAGKQVELAMLITASALPSLRSGAFKALAVTGSSRLAALPQVPAISESAVFKGYNVVSWAGLYAPANTPADIVQRMSQELGDVLKMDAVRGRLAEQSIFTQGSTPAGFVQFIEQDRAQVKDILQVLSLKE